MFVANNPYVSHASIEIYGAWLARDLQKLVNEL